MPSLVMLRLFLIHWFFGCIKNNIPCIISTKKLFTKIPLSKYGGKNVFWYIICILNLRPQVSKVLFIFLNSVPSQN